MIFLVFQFLVAILVIFFAIWIAGLWFLAWRSRRPRQAPPETTATPFFSIIVPAHDERETIEATVKKIMAFEYPRADTSDVCAGGYFPPVYARDARRSGDATRALVGGRTRGQRCSVAGGSSSGAPCRAYT